jgi:transcriptional regulator with XRE-family HTH domain
VNLATTASNVESTSAAGAMLTRHVVKPVVLVLMLSGLGTTSAQPSELDTAKRVCGLDQTTGGPAEQSSARNPGHAISELRRLSGLTWDQLARLFDVSRRSLHFWASGKPSTPANEERLQRLVAVMRKIDRGSAAETRAVLLAPLRDGRLPVDLLAEGRLEDVERLVGPGTPTARIRPPQISDAARRARMPPPPNILANALQDRVHVEPRGGRPAKSVRFRGDKRSDA